ncbi:sorting nexin-25-like isoform X2 [Lineus longissimus]
MDLLMVISIGVGVVSSLYAVGWLTTSVHLTICLLTTSLGVVIGASMALESKQHKPQAIRSPSVTKSLAMKMIEKKQSLDFDKTKVVISHNLDEAIKEVQDLVVRDYVHSWYDEIGKDQKVMQSMEADIWKVIGNVSLRLGKVDLVTVMSQDIVNKLCQHFQEIKDAAIRPKGSGPRPKFLLHPWLVSEEKELTFVRKVSEVLLLHVLPKEYAMCKASRELLREILACRVMKPIIDLMCDPDYINQKIFDFFDYREKLAAEHQRTYSHAASYEDFVKMIRACQDIEHLKQIRYYIMSEVMQAATINNLKKEKGIDAGKSPAAKGTTKGHLLKARDLKKYINQLTVCKVHCEKRIRLLGGPDYQGYGEDGEKEQAEKIPGKKVLSFQVIMENPKPRNYFMKYLKKDDKHSLLGFWLAVENFRHTDKSRWHQLASEIFQMYVSSPSSVVKVSRSVIKAMEGFMIGDKGPEAFFGAQSQIYQELEEHHYPSFIVSDVYHSYAGVMEEAAIDEKDSSDGPAGKLSKLIRTKSMSTTDGAFIAGQSEYARRKLIALDEKLENKGRALDALRQSHQRSDSKRLKLQEDIEKEMEMLKIEKQNLEFHIDRTSMWCDNVGKWQAVLQNGDVSQEGSEGPMVSFLLIVHLLGKSFEEAASQPGGTHGWVISRNLADFRKLNENLSQISPWLAKRVLPSVSKFRIKAIDKTFLDKAKETLQDYMNTVLKDERLAQNEAVYEFLSPSPQHLKQAVPVENKKVFSLPSVLKSQTADADDELLFLDDDSTKDDSDKDSIAGPLYGLISEVFELKGIFKWVRKSFISFVQVTSGRTINRQIRETVDWIFSEPMLIYYIHNLRDSMWPNGKLAEWGPPHSDEEKMRTRMMAKQIFLENNPDFLKNLIGEKNAKQGAIKMFESLQDVRLNKHLFYVILEVLLLEICPEVADSLPQPLQQGEYGMIV